jgi:hypothetical protein
VETTTQWPLVANIRATARRCEAEGIGVSDKALRQWVRDGAFPTVPVGNSRFINWDTLMNFLNTGSTPPRRSELPYRKARR